MTTSTGSQPANLHEGNRSEYLAQYVFASFGTAILVHKEDTGIDLYCTLTKRVGQRAWPRAHYTLQVKSGSLDQSGRRPRRRRSDAWVFDGAESVRWLLDHPLPLFLCVIDKKDARLSLFKTHARFAANFQQPRPSTVRLHPRSPPRLRQTKDVWDLALGPPILDADIVGLLRDETNLRWREVLEDWAKIDEEAISRSNRGIKLVMNPTYKTNERPTWETWSASGAGFGHNAVPHLLKVLEEFSSASQGDSDPDTRVAETLICMLHRQLNVVSGVPERGDRMQVSHNTVNALLKVTGHPFGGAERLLDGVRRAIRGES
jgi:hypothetical protein